MISSEPIGNKLNTSTNLQRRTLEKLIGDSRYREFFNSSVDQAIELIDSGYSGKKLLDKLQTSPSIAVQISEIAYSRISSRGRFSAWDRIWLDFFSSRYATPENICRYRAGRIKDRDLIDIGSGAGLQALFFSKFGRNKVWGIERDPIRYCLSRLNSFELEETDVKFFLVDFFEMDTSTLNLNDPVVFSDPLRLTNSGRKSMDHLVPSPGTVIQKMSGHSSDFCFDLPPTFNLEDIGIPGEKEYLSVDHILKRLTLYTGALAENNASATLLPHGKSYSGNPRPLPVERSQPSSYIYMADPAVVKAGLLAGLMEEFSISLIYTDARRSLLTSHNLHQEFPGEIYEVKGSGNRRETRGILMSNDAGKVFLRYAVNPDEYYSIRDELQDGLTGSLKFYIFEINGKLYSAIRSERVLKE